MAVDYPLHLVRDLRDPNTEIDLWGVLRFEDVPGGNGPVPLRNYIPAHLRVTLRVDPEVHNAWVARAHGSEMLTAWAEWLSAEVTKDAATLTRDTVRTLVQRLARDSAGSTLSVGVDSICASACQWVLWALDLPPERAPQPHETEAERAARHTETLRATAFGPPANRATPGGCAECGYATLPCPVCQIQASTFGGFPGVPVIPTPAAHATLTENDRKHPGWIGVDFDGTLAHYVKWEGPDVIGEPIPAMVERVKRWLAAGVDVRIFTARVSVGPQPETVEGARETLRQIANVAAARLAIEAWCEKHIGRKLPITCTKDLEMRELYDDRAVAVEMNTGLLLSPSTRGLPE